jgi:hypothetical protein
MRWYLPFLVLDLALHVVDRVRALHLEGDGLAGERLNEDLHGYGVDGEEGRVAWGQLWLGSSNERVCQTRVALISRSLTQRIGSPGTVGNLLGHVQRQGPL